MDFTQEFIKSRFDYNSETGVIINKNTNRPVTASDKDGYIVCGVIYDPAKRPGKMRGARLVWVMHNGPIPDKMVVDHINRIKTDNRLCNLRLAFCRENTVNSKRLEDNYSSLYKGVQLDKWGRWKATIQVSKKTIFIGNFSTQEAAAYAYNTAAKELHGEFAFLNNVPEINLEDFKSERTRDFLTEERRGLPKGLHRLGTDLAVRVKATGETIARFKKEHSDDAVKCAEHYNATGEILDMTTNIVSYNKYGLPHYIVPCSTGFRASFFHKEKRIHVGTFNTVEEAVAAMGKKKEEVLNG